MYTVCTVAYMLFSQSHTPQCPHSITAHWPYSHLVIPSHPPSLLPSPPPLSPPHSPLTGGLQIHDLSRVIQDGDALYDIEVCTAQQQHAVLAVQTSQPGTLELQLNLRREEGGGGGGGGGRGEGRGEGREGEEEVCKINRETS